MLTEEQKATNYDTFRHIERVRNLLNQCTIELLKRGELHDQTKLESPEVEALTEYTPKLAGCTYGSEEYNGFRNAMKPALEHHYARNRHHPEFMRSDEKWLPVIGYEGLYEVSSYGSVRSMDRTSTHSDGKSTFRSGKVLNSYFTPKGYLRLSLSNNGTAKNHFVHRIVAEAFIHNDDPENKFEINHKDGVKSNNRVGNLEWASPSDNLMHAYDAGLRDATIKYVVTCEELNITTFGCLEMTKKCNQLGYHKVTDSGVWNSINGGGKHINLEFTGTRFEKWMDSPLNDMNLIDLLEMFCDWVAASERHNDGNIVNSIEFNKDRFKMSEQLVSVFKNTVDAFGVIKLQREAN